MTHQEVRDLLPWYAAKSLSSDEHKSVQHHLEQCDDCALELAQFQELQLSDAELSGEVPAAPANMLDQAFAQIAVFESERVAVGKAESEDGAGWRSWWDMIWNPAPSMARAVMAAQFALLLALGAGLLLQNAEPYYGVLGGQGTDDGSTISVQFVETATEAQMRSLLDEIGGTLIGGPSGLGLYTVRVPIDPENAEEVDALVEQLRLQDSIVRFVARGP